MRWGFLADAHGNVEAFDQAIDLLIAMAVDEIIFLGDAVGYLPGDAVIDRLRSRQIRSVMGNHEDMLLRGAFSQHDAIYRLSETAAGIHPENRAEIARWPKFLEIESDRGILMLLHGSPADPVRGYVYPNTPLEPFAVDGRSAVFMGNTHRPFVRTCNDALFVNVGSCGMPRDCGNLGAVCVFDGSTSKATIMRFDITAATTKAIRRCGGVAPEVAAVFARRDPVEGLTYND
jgi:predicted phosphodiesterase